MASAQISETTRPAYLWSGSEWIPIGDGGGGGGGEIFYQSASPSAPEVGTLWVDEDGSVEDDIAGISHNHDLTYLSLNTASNTYLTINNASNTYATIVDLNNIDLTSTINTASAAAYASASAYTDQQISVIDLSATIQTASAAAVNYLVDSAPGTLDTLNELSAALNDDSNFYSTIQSVYLTQSNASATYLTQSSASVTFATIEDLNNLDALPNQTGNDGKYLITSGASASWATLDLSTKADKLVTFDPETASYELIIGNADQIIEMNVGTANTVTVPLDSSVNFHIGTQITILQTGTGQTTITPATVGVTINATPGLKLRTQWSSVTLIKRAANTWVAIGDLIA
jgi:hypothetical protein